MSALTLKIQTRTRLVLLNHCISAQFFLLVFLNKDYIALNVIHVKIRDQNIYKIEPRKNEKEFINHISLLFKIYNFFIFTSIQGISLKECLLAFLKAYPYFYSSRIYCEDQDDLLVDDLFFEDKFLTPEERIMKNLMCGKTTPCVNGEHNELSASMLESFIQINIKYLIDIKKKSNQLKKKKTLSAQFLELIEIKVYLIGKDDGLKQYIPAIKRLSGSFDATEKENDEIYQTYYKPEIEKQQRELLKHLKKKQKDTEKTLKKMKKDLKKQIAKEKKIKNKLIKKKFKIKS